METPENLEKKLSALPKHKLRFTSDLKIKTLIYKLTIQKKIADLANSFSFKGFFLHKAWLVGVLALVMLSSVSFYAYGSEQVTLGTPLYPLKKTIETTKNKLTSSAVERAKNFNELYSRRLEEALILSNKENKKIENNNNIVKTIDKAMENFDKSVISTETIDNGQELKAIINKIRKNNDDNLQVLEKIEKNVNISEQEDIAEKINEAKNKIEKYNHDLEEDSEEDEEREDRGGKKDEKDKK